MVDEDRRARHQLDPEDIVVADIVLLARDGLTERLECHRLQIAALQNDPRVIEIIVDRNGLVRELQVQDAPQRVGAIAERAATVLDGEDVIAPGPVVVGLVARQYRGIDVTDDVIALATLEAAGAVTAVVVVARSADDGVADLDVLGAGTLEAQAVELRLRHHQRGTAVQDGFEVGEGRTAEVDERGVGQVQRVVAGPAIERGGQVVGDIDLDLVITRTSLDAEFSIPIDDQAVIAIAELDAVKVRDSNIVVVKPRAVVIITAPGLWP